MPKTLWGMLELLWLAYCWPAWTMMVIREIVNKAERLSCYVLSIFTIHFMIKSVLYLYQTHESITLVILNFVLFMSWIGGVIIIAIGTETAQHYGKKTSSEW